MAEQEYTDQEPLIPFKIQAYTKSGKARFACLINTIAEHSPTGRSVLRAAAGEGYGLQMMLMSGMSGFVCPENKTIYLNSACSDGALIETLAHECRHVEQHAKGVPDHHYECVLRDAVKLSRAAEADAETIGASACYEIMVNGGNDAPWKALEEKAPKITQGMAGATAYPGAPLTAEMMRGAFDGWYRNKAIMDIYEDSYIMGECLGNALSTSYKNNPADYFKREMSSAEIVNMFCTDGQGKCYWAGKPDVLDEPERLQVREKVIASARNVNAARAEMGLKPDHSYRDLYVYGQSFEPADRSSQTENKAAALAAGLARRKLSR